jgi:hypothetical protein
MVQQLASRARLIASACARLIKPKLLPKKLRPDGAKCAPIPPVRGNDDAPPARRPPGKFIFMVANAKSTSSSRTHLLTDGLQMAPSPRARVQNVILPVSVSSGIFSH